MMIFHFAVCVLSLYCPFVCVYLSIIHYALFACWRCVYSFHWLHSLDVQLLMLIICFVCFWIPYVVRLILLQATRMKTEIKRWSKSLAALVTGLRNNWVRELLVFKSQTVSEHHLVSLRLASLAGLQIWKGEFTYASQACMFILICICRSLLDFSVYVCQQTHCRLMKAQNVGDTSSFDFMKGRRVLEINPEHPIIKSLNVWLIAE